MNRFPPLAFVWLAAVAGCSRDAGDETPAATAMPASGPGLYAGEFPCSNCAAIAATLWLRPDGSFFLRQRFVEAAEAGALTAAPSATFGLGRWSWDERAAQLVLRGAGPERRLVVHTDDRLQLLVPSPIEHALTRDSTSPAFVDRLSLDGESAVTENGATFTECLTGLTFAVADAGAYRELRRQHRRLNPRGKVALTTVEARLVAAPDDAAPEQLVIERYVTMKPGTACPQRG
jgi:uncharacterized lipoprotein NlpE involved in copper resistance